jgi:hypothetical protein
MNRSKVMISGCLLLAALSGPAGAAEKPPNILYIMADDHAAHAISAYGSHVNKRRTSTALPPPACASPTASSRTRSARPAGRPS